MTMITPSYLGETIEYSSLHACRSTLEDPTMHQIRLQAALRGWPIRGDVLYGSVLPFGPAVELPRDRVIALHARSLTFLHPIRFEPITVTAALPASWQEVGVCP